MKPPVKPLIGALKAARQRMALSQRALGDRTGIAQGRLSRIESGEVDLRASSLLELARGLDLEVMLVPRRLVPVVEGLAREAPSSTEVARIPRPLYRLNDEDD